MESAWLYREGAGADAPQTVSAMNAYWRAQLLQEIADDPAAWLGLMARKVFYAANDWEQYNNLTYAYHKERWSYLRWNPLGWGLLLIAAAIGLIAGFPRARRPALYALGLIALAYLAGLLLFFVSARFRLPLAPLLCVALGGCVFLGQIKSAPKRIWLGVSALVITLLSFGDWFEARDRAPFVQDALLLAQASSEVGDDGAALRLSQTVLAEDPNRPEAQRLEVTSLFNLWLASGDAAHWRTLGEALDALTSSDPSVAFIRGVHYCRSGQREAALATWEAAVARYGVEAGSSAVALEVVTDRDGVDHPAIRRILGISLDADRP